ncbi:alpha/beta fold hydrolase [Salipaludibacillus aurantiacus]|nr:alpha/beta hydrolase [Salipaludibacillus aurantiacus]
MKMGVLAMPFTKDEHAADIYYEKEGKGIPLLFVHPPSMGHVTFRRQKSRLSNDYQVMTMDLRGNGRSGMDERPLSMPLLAEDVKRVLDAENVKSAFICGYSNGGSIVQETAIQYPDRVRGIILMGGFSEVNSFLLRNEFRLGIYAARAKQMGLIANVLALAHEREPRRKKDLADYVKRMSPHLLEQYYRLGLAYSATARLEQIQCPVLLLYGNRDDYVHHYRHLFHEKVSGPVETILLGDVGHQLPTKKSSAVHHLIKQFVKKYN